MAHHHTHHRRRFLELGASLLAAGVSSPALAASGELAIIVHPENHEPLTPAEVEAIFRTTKRHWSNGAPITAFNLVPGSSERTLFDQAALHLAPAAVARYWIDRKIRGGAPPPRSAPNAAVVERVVASLPSAIGYVPPELLTPSVRTVAWIRKGDLASARALFAPLEDA